MRDAGVVDGRVLLTGASGFIAKQILLDLLDEGYRVRGTVRSQGKADELSSFVARSRPGLGGRFEIAFADLNRDEGWEEAVRDCEYVLHTASPFPLRSFSDRQALVPVARGGTERVIRAAADTGVQRLVLTSSVASVSYGHEGRHEFGEADWTRVESPSVSAYAVSKTEAERAAWRECGARGLPMVAINPAVVLGPVQDLELGTSARIVEMMMRGKAPLVPRVSFGIVDVRDVAQAHLRALRIPEAAGRRFILSAGSLSLYEIGCSIAAESPHLKRRVPKATLPDWVLKVAGRFSRQAGMLSAELGSSKTYECSPAREVLGLELRDPREAVAATTRSLMKLGVGAGR